ncbi:hypothetical protein ACU4GD_41605 [Cupriavidus basilensis]
MSLSTALQACRQMERAMACSKPGRARASFAQHTRQASRWRRSREPAATLPDPAQSRRHP